jgi:glucose-1-phosphate thymidylyltransferase
MKGIILAGGSGTRLFPATQPVCKQLLPIYDKPMIYYPLSTLMLAGIREVLIISTPADTARFEQLFGDGHELGMQFSYKVQEHPRGLADAFVVGREFAGSDSVCLVLGDNIFFGHDFVSLLRDAAAGVDANGGATVFGYHVHDPERYGVVDFDGEGQVLSIEEKPAEPKSNYAVVGLYFYDNAVLDIAANLAPSPRGEIEITDVNKEYLKRDALSVQLMGRGYAWLDTGTHESMVEATNFVKAVEDRQGLKIGCIEEIAWRQGFIDDAGMELLATRYEKSGYGVYLREVMAAGRTPGAAGAL